MNIVIHMLCIYRAEETITCIHTHTHTHTHTHAHAHTCTRTHTHTHTTLTNLTMAAYTNDERSYSYIRRYKEQNHTCHMHTCCMLYYITKYYASTHKAFL